MNKPVSSLAPKDIREELVQLRAATARLNDACIRNATNISAVQMDLQALMRSHRSSGFIYIASPYTHKDPEVVLQRYKQTQWYTIGLLRNRKWCFSPIIHCHQLSLDFGLPTDALFWMDYNCAMLSAAKELHVLCLDGWEESVGVKNEVAFWRHAREQPAQFISLTITED